MIPLGWQVFSRSLPEHLAPARRRRMLAVATVAFVVAGAALAVTQLAFHWDRSSTWRILVGSTLVMFAAAALGAACCRMGPRGGEDPGVPPSGVRAQDRLARYLGSSPPPMLPEDRALVLADTAHGRRQGVRETLRAGLVCAAFIAGTAGIAIGGLLSDTALQVPWALALAAGYFLRGLFQLGRGERARREAEALPVVPEEPGPSAGPRRGRNGTPGSKLSLPDE